MLRVANAVFTDSSHNGSVSSDELDYGGHIAIKAGSAPFEVPVALELPWQILNESINHVDKILSVLIFFALCMSICASALDYSLSLARSGVLQCETSCISFTFLACLSTTSLPPAPVFLKISHPSDLHCEAGSLPLYRWSLRKVLDDVRSYLHFTRSDANI